MNWDESLLPEQRIAASTTGNNVRLLAGPGTGKTYVLSRRINYLINQINIPPENILCLTFTRAATYELIKRVRNEIGEDNPQPRIQTLHSFSLRQLLKNSTKINALPAPLRVADDWEERHIILEDYKHILEISSIKEVKKEFNKLSSDWQTLSADSGSFSPDPAFIGLWKRHREVFGYTLRSELVYQLKRALEQILDFNLELPISHLIVDEYQDLNVCDLWVINFLASQSCELFVAGDDDQSIYGFRMAHPDGIRNFFQTYPHAEDLFLSLCIRCDKKILEISEFVANLDYHRIQKGTKVKDDAQDGEVALLVFDNQFSEAKIVAQICKKLIEIDGYLPSDILILSRADTNNAYSRIIEEEFNNYSIPFSKETSDDIFCEDEGRLVLANFRLLNNQKDHLAWRTIIQIRKNNIGEGIINQILNLCLDHGMTFSQTLDSILSTPEKLPIYGDRVAKEIKKINRFNDDLLADFDFQNISHSDLKSILLKIIQFYEIEEFNHEDILSHLDQNMEEKIFDLGTLLRVIDAIDIDIEQEIDVDCVNMLTMHKAKGLTSKVVIVLAVDDEIIPGRNENEPDLGDERRLLFVSLSRAKHTLIITYCNKRMGQQRNLGRSTGTSRRNLTRFLTDSVLVPEDGKVYFSRL